MSHRTGDTAGCALRVLSGSMLIRGASTVFVSHLPTLIEQLLTEPESYGVFLAYYLAHNRFPRASSIEFAFVGGLSISQAFLVSPVATYITRVYGTRTTLLIGVFLQALAMIIASFAQHMWQLLLSKRVCF